MYSILLLYCIPWPLLLYMFCNTEEKVLYLSYKDICHNHCFIKIFLGWAFWRFRLYILFWQDYNDIGYWKYPFYVQFNWVKVGDSLHLDCIKWSLTSYPPWLMLYWLLIILPSIIHYSWGYSSSVQSDLGPLQTLPLHDQEWSLCILLTPTPQSYFREKLDSSV